MNDVRDKFAWVVSTNKAYWPSVNAMLRALDYYGYGEELDVHILHTPDVAEDIAKVKDIFQFGIVPAAVGWYIQPLPDTKPPHGTMHNLVYAKYKYIPEKLGDYASVMHIDGDCLILGNFYEYFRIAAMTDYYIAAQFPHTNMTIEDYKTGVDPEFIHAVGMPIANFPNFYDPKIHGKTLRKVWENQPDEVTPLPPGKEVEMYFLTKALYEDGVMEAMLVLPGNLWVTDAFVGHTPIHEVIVAGKKTLINATGDRIQVIHNKWWKEGVAAAELERNPNRELVKANIDKMLSMFEFFTNHKTAKEIA